jgi:hypothetical protein
MPTELDAKWRKARKTHKCSMCTGTIPRGETYHWFKYVESLGLYELKICEPCSNIFLEVASYVDDWRYVNDEGIGFEDYEEWATDTDYPDTPEKQAWRQRSGCIRYDEEDQ